MTQIYMYNNSNYSITDSICVRIRNWHGPSPTIQFDFDILITLPFTTNYKPISIDGADRYNQ